VHVETLFRYLKYGIQEAAYRITRVLLASSFSAISLSGINFVFLGLCFSHRDCLIQRTLMRMVN